MPKNLRAGFGDVILTLIIAGGIVIAAAFIAGGYSFRFHAPPMSATPAARRSFPFLIPAPTATSTQQTATTTSPQ